MNILEEIIESKIAQVAQRKQEQPISALENSKYFSRSTLSLRSFLLNPDKTGIIAEFKRRSPSKGIINQTSKVEQVVKDYADSGASGVSILTEMNYFAGRNEDLSNARPFCLCPILRKDFIIDEYQVIEAKSLGADVILLIAACLDKKKIKSLSELAVSCSMEVLLEIHDEQELDKIPENTTLVGINNRNLKTFHLDIEHSIKLASKLPESVVKISESGIDNTAVIRKMKTYGFKGFLMGENFMKTTDPGKAFTDFIKQL